MQAVRHLFTGLGKAPALSYTPFQPGTIVRGKNERGLSYHLVVSADYVAQLTGDTRWVAKHSAQVAYGEAFYSTLAAYVFHAPRDPQITAVGLSWTRNYVSVDPTDEIRFLKESKTARQGEDCEELSDQLLSNLISGLERFLQAQH